MADLELQATEAVMLDGAPALVHQRVLGDRQPADIGVVGLQARLRRAAEQLPQRHVRELRAQVPQRDIDGGERDLGDAGAAHPAQCRMARQLQPQPIAVPGILAEQQRRVAVGDARGDQAVGRQMRVRAGEAEPYQPGRR